MSKVTAKQVTDLLGITISKTLVGQLEALLASNAFEPDPEKTRRENALARRSELPHDDPLAADYDDLLAFFDAWENESHEAVMGEYQRYIDAQEPKMAWHTCTVCFDSCTKVDAMGRCLDCCDKANSQESLPVRHDFIVNRSE